MTLTLPNRPAKYFINEVLVPNWDETEALGYDPTEGPSKEGHLPTATTIDNVGAVYPSLVVQFSNETTGGQSTYDFMTRDGPGQTRTGTLVATARAQDKADGGYTGDSSTYTAQSAEDVVVTIIEALENLCQRNATAPSTDFETIGSQRGPDAPDDFDEDPTVRLETCQVSYSWIRDP